MNASRKEMTPLNRHGSLVLADCSPTTYANVVSFAPRFTVDESDTAMVIRGDLPGIPPAGVRVTVENGELVVQGERLCRAVEAAAHRTIDERPHGTFVRAFALPFEVTPNRVHAELVDGILSICIVKHGENAPGGGGYSGRHSPNRTLGCS